MHTVLSGTLQKESVYLGFNKWYHPHSIEQCFKII
jgi:hypothetical protein